MRQRRLNYDVYGSFIYCIIYSAIYTHAGGAIFFLGGFSFHARCIFLDSDTDTESLEISNRIV